MCGARSRQEYARHGVAWPSLPQSLRRRRSNCENYFSAGTALGAATATRLPAVAFTIALVRWRAVKLAPNAKRIIGPNVFAADTPAKYRPGTEDSKFEERIVVRLR